MDTNVEPQTSDSQSTDQESEEKVQDDANKVASATEVDSEQPQESTDTKATSDDAQKD